jgi:ribosome-associated toxin RatA of RatAB toxin-antitoxin module
MPHVIEKSALVWHSSERMYTLVNDVSRYPEFLPWCAGAEVHEQSATEILASIDVAKSGLRQRLTTRNQLTEPHGIAMALEAGPFRELHGGWTFVPLGENACKVIFNLQFEVGGSLARVAFGKMFGQVAGTMVDAFCQRANTLYGVAP